MTKLLQPLYTAWVVFTFAASVLPAFPFIYLIGIAGSKGSRKAIFNIVKYWSKWWLWVIGMRPRVSGILPQQNKYILVANHISYLDPILIFAVINNHFRPLGKKEFAKIPIIGFIYKQVAILVDRSSSEGRSKSMRLMWHIFRHECNILVFPEGTFNETGNRLKSFYDGAFRLAINTGADILPMVFPDTVNRWHYSAWWKLKPGRNRVIFLDTIPTHHLKLADMPLLKQKVYDLMDAALHSAILET